MAGQAPARQRAGWRLAAIGVLAIGVAGALYAAGRPHQPDYAVSLFGADPVPAKSLLATIALGLAGLQVVLALWIYRKLPLAGAPPRPVAAAHRVIGFATFAVTVPVAVHCLIAYGVQLTSVRVVVHSIAGCFFYGAFAAKVLLVHSRRLPGYRTCEPAGCGAFAHHNADPYRGRSRPGRQAAAASGALAAGAAGPASAGGEPSPPAQRITKKDSRGGRPTRPPPSSAALNQLSGPAVMLREIVMPSQAGR